MTPKISLIIPVYNVEKYLTKCLNSAIDQTLKEIEILIINDGSTDNSLNISERFAKEDNRIKIFTQENKGQGFARNLGIKKAIGKFIFCLDADDWIELDTLEKLYKKTQAEQSDVVICGWNKIEENSGKTLATRVDIHNLKDTSKESILKKVFSGDMNLMACACLISKSIFDENYLIYPDVYHEDLYVMPKVYYYARKISIEKKNLYNWLTRVKSTTNSANMKHTIGICGALCDLKIFLYKKNIYSKYEKLFVKLVLTYLNLLINNTEKFASSEDKVQTYKLISETLLSIPELKNFDSILNKKELSSRVKILNFYIEILDQVKNIKINDLNKDAITNNRETAISNLNRLLKERDVLIQNRDRGIVNLKEVVEEQETLIDNRDNGIANLKTQLEKQETLIQNRDRGIVNLKQSIKNRNEKIENLTTALVEKKLAIEKMEQASRDEITLQKTLLEKNQRMHNILVSIIMPAYNSEKTIKESIESIQKQTYSKWELLIIDDGCKDNTIDIVQNMIQDDDRIKLYRNTKKGVSSARNYGIDNAKGEYICFLDSDDLYSKDVIYNRMKFMEENDVQATTCEIVLTDENFTDLGWILRGKKVLKFEDFNGCPVHTDSVMFRSSVLEKLRFDEEFTNGEDWLMWQRIARMGIDFYRVDGCRIYYRQHNSVVRDNFLRHENSLLDVLDIVYGEDPDCPNPLPKYKNGLIDRDKKKTILKRRIGLFNYLLLEKKLKAARDLGQEILESEVEVNAKDIMATIKYSTMRYHLCHANEYIDFIRTNKVLKKNYKRFFSSEIYEELEKNFFTSEENKLVSYLSYLKKLKIVGKNVYHKN